MKVFTRKCWNINVIMIIVQDQNHLKYYFEILSHNSTKKKIFNIEMKFILINYKSITKISGHQQENIIVDYEIVMYRNINTKID